MNRPVIPSPSIGTANGDSTMKCYILLALATRWTASGLVPISPVRNHLQRSTTTHHTINRVERISTLRAQFDDSTDNQVDESFVAVQGSEEDVQEFENESNVNGGEDEEVDQNEEAFVEKLEFDEDIVDGEFSELEVVNAEDDEISELQIFDEINMEMAIQVAQSA